MKHSTPPTTDTPSSPSQDPWSIVGPSVAPEVPDIQISSVPNFLFPTSQDLHPVRGALACLPALLAIALALALAEQSLLTYHPDESPQSCQENLSPFYELAVCGFIYL